MSKGRIKVTTGVIPPTPPRVEYETTAEVQELMEEFETRFSLAPALSRFNPTADPVTNFKKVILKQ